MNIPILSNFHILTIKVIGPTNISPAKVKIISERFNMSVKIPFTTHPGASSPSIDTASLWLTAKGFNLIGKGEGKGHMYIITDTFESLK